MSVSAVTSRTGDLWTMAPPTRLASTSPAGFDVPDWRNVSEARRQAEKLTASALITPILAELRESSVAAAPFAPTMAEKRFGPIADSIVADRIVQAANFPIVDAIARRFGDGAAPRANPGSRLELTA